jgi:hypothetical protein
MARLCGSSVDDRKPPFVSVILLKSYSMYAVRSNFLAGRMPSSLGCVKAPAPAPVRGAGVLEEASRWVRGTEEREEKGRFWPRGAVLLALEGALRLLASAAVRKALAFRRFSS